MERKHILPAVLLLTVLLLLAFLLPAQAETLEERKATVLIYMCGADLDTMEKSMATNVLSSINSLKYNKEEVNVIVLQGGARMWRTKLDTSVLTISKCGGRRTQPVDTMPLSSMGDPATLTAFLDYAREHYPAERYYLIMWDHGGGPNLGVCFDALFDSDSLSVNELASAIGASQFADRGFEIIAFNTCLTGSLEYAAALAPYAKYMIATEDSMYGLDYEWLKSLDTESDALAISKLLVDGTFLLNKEIIERQHASEINSVTAFDLQNLSSLPDAMDAFFTKVTPSLDKTTFSQMSSKRRNSVTFGVTESGGNRDYDLADFGSLVLNLKEYAPEEADTLLNLMKEVVAYNRSVIKDCIGATVYHPLVNKSRMMSFMAAHNDIQLSNGYSAYIQQFAAMLTGTPLADWSGLSAEASVNKVNRNLFNLALTEQQSEQMADAELYILRKLDDGIFSFVAENRNVRKEDLVLTGEYTGTALYAVTDGEAVSPPLGYHTGSEDVWTVPALVTVGDTQLNGLIRCELDKGTETLTPGSVLVLDEATGMYSTSYGVAFEDCTSVSLPIISRKETRDENGVMLRFEDWDIISEENWEARNDGSWQFALLHDTIEPGELFAAFQVQDTQSEYHTSELAAAQGGAASAGDAIVSYDDINLLQIDRFTVSILQDQLLISANLTNLGETEALIRMSDLTLNGQAAEAEAEVFGNGENWGLLTGESQSLSLSLEKNSLPVSGELTEMAFLLHVVDAATEEELGAIPVSVSVSLNLE